jgi:hypothetical protein
MRRARGQEEPNRETVVVGTLQFIVSKSDIQEGLQTFQRKCIALPPCAVRLEDPGGSASMLLAAVSIRFPLAYS